jgi:D-arginine dehydrogenase
MLGGMTDPRPAPSVDVAVIGGGMAGMSVAAELAGARSVAVLEQEGELGHHATGRSAAMLLESYGNGRVRALTRASRRRLEAVEDGAALLEHRPLLWVAGAGDVGVVERMLADQPGLRALSPEEAVARCPVLRPDAIAAVAEEPDAHDIDVAGLLQRYVTSATAAGVEVHRGARLERAERVRGAWLLHHRGGTLRASVVVDAAGAWADEVGRLLGARPLGLQPLRRTIAIARSPRPVDPAWPMVADVEDAFYFRPEGPNLLVSPADETPSEPCDARPEEVDVALAIERVNAVTDLGLRSVVSTWAGLRTFAPDRTPVAGFDPRVEGLFWLAGQGGYGIQTAPALAELAAALLLDDPAAPTLVPDLDLTDLSPARF